MCRRVHHERAFADITGTKRPARGSRHCASTVDTAHRPGARHPCQGTFVATLAGVCQHTGTRGTQRLTAAHQAPKRSGSQQRHIFTRRAPLPAAVSIWSYGCAAAPAQRLLCMFDSVYFACLTGGHADPTPRAPPSPRSTGALQGQHRTLGTLPSGLGTAQGRPCHTPPHRRVPC